MIALQAVLFLVLGAAVAPSKEAALEVQPKPMLRFNSQNRFFHHRLHRYVPPPPPGNNALTATAVETLYLDQILDHFNPTNKKTWKQRYFSRSDLYEAGGPVFIHIGGESPEMAETLGDTVRFLTFLAKPLKAKTFNLEHRYFGESLPTTDLSSANLQYLTVDQALADLAYFIQYLKKKGEIVEGQKVAVFGGSYPGILAAFARYKYPHLIQAAVASSAPVHAQADFFEYMEVVGRSMTKVAGQFCYDNVKMATDRIAQLLKTTDGYKAVKDAFQLGSELKDKRDLDVFFENLSGPFAGAVQYNRESTTHPEFNIKNICSSMSGDNLTPDEAVKKLATLILGPKVTKDTIIDMSYKSTIESYKDINFASATSPDYMERQWLYQTCTEFGYYQTYGGTNVPFPKDYNDVSYDYQTCKDVFGEDYDKNLVSSAVERTNIIFGGRKPDVTNVIFVNGDVDPWHALGILEDVGPDAPAILIDGGSHCADMYYPSPSDTKAITDAHEEIHHFLRAALYEEPNSDRAEA